MFFTEKSYGRFKKLYEEERKERAGLRFPNSDWPKKNGLVHIPYKFHKTLCEFYLFK